ncbi:MAG: hypothetical protein RLZZ479_11 [Bacteroidota bacterium]
MNNREKIRAIIDQQIQKLYEISDTSSKPLFDKEIDSLAKLAKLVESEALLDNLKDNAKFDELTEEELMLLYKFRQSKNNG